MTKEYATLPVHPDTAKLAGECSGSIAISLGESPEAWRGAAVMAHFIKATCMAAIDALLDETGELELSDFELTQMLTVGMLERLPMWPEGVTGEPLMYDGEPEAMRPHFRAVSDE